MPSKVYAIIFSLAVIAAGCKSSDTSTPANSATAPAAPSPAIGGSPPATTSALSNTAVAKSKIDPCKLLTSDDLKAVQGESLKDALRSDRDEGGMIISQCYYSLSTASNSVVVNVTTASEGTGARDPKDYWKDTFVHKGEKSSERDRDKKKGKPAQQASEGEMEEESAKPEKVNGLGDDAYWLTSPVGGALYVLKKNAFFRISVGGAGDAKSKLNKSKTLAHKALGRM